MTGGLSLLACCLACAALPASAPPRYPASAPPRYPASAPATSPTSEPRAIAVPPALAAISRLEPSGLAWAPALDRFLVVSDDTGLADGDDEGAPWLFAMDRAGRLDPAPLAIRGVERVSDLEAIADAGDGSYYLVCSQSKSSRGKRPAKRTCLIRIAVEGRTLRALGQIDLLGSILDAARAEGGAAWLRELGLQVAGTAVPGRRDVQLNIEGAAVRDGALLLGLKQPLDDRGRAAIWELRQPDRLFTTRRLRRGDLSRIASVALTAEVGGRSAPAGIAELLALDDGGLLIAATSPTRGPQSGALWLLLRGGAAVRVASFAGLKPEGVSLGPDRGTLYVVFDRQQETPQWATLPLPVVPPH
ncbi:MAG: hypothetical protein JXR83_22265 [Deltaproteobacteria bacterium]|nr:hypothetical protein [Deltaproteobacteria bacterium]